MQLLTSSSMAICYRYLNYTTAGLLRKLLNEKYEIQISEILGDKDVIDLGEVPLRKTPVALSVLNEC